VCARRRHVSNIFQDDARKVGGVLHLRACAGGRVRARRRHVSNILQDDACKGGGVLRARLPLIASSRYLLPCANTHTGQPQRRAQLCPHKPMPLQPSHPREAADARNLHDKWDLNLPCCPLEGARAFWSPSLQSCEMRRGGVCCSATALLPQPC